MQYSSNGNISDSGSTIDDSDIGHSKNSETNGAARTLVQKDLTEAAYKTSNLSREEAAFIVNQVLDRVINTIATGEEVKLHGFEKFKVLTKKARVGRNPRTGVEAAITARRVDFH